MAIRGEPHNIRMLKIILRPSKGSKGRPLVGVGAAGPLIIPLLFKGGARGGLLLLFHFYFPLMAARYLL